MYVDLILINRQRINRVHYTRDNIHTRLMLIHKCCISKSPFCLSVTITPMSHQSLQNWMVHMWLCQPWPWTHTMQERRRKVSIQLLGLPSPVALCRTDNVPRVHAYVRMYVGVCTHVAVLSYHSFFWKLDMPPTDYPTSWAALWLKVSLSTL